MPWQRKIPMSSHEGRPFNMRIFASLLSVAIILSVLGCATPHIQGKAPGYLENTELGFLHIGETTREDILIQLGHPASSFENGRILIYLISVNDKGKVAVHAPRTVGKSVWGWDEGESLVLVFGTGGTLQRISVVGSQ